MLNCHEATRLLSESHERELGLGEHLNLFMHLRVCSGCRQFKVQVQHLSDLAHHFAAQPPTGDDREA